MSAAAALVALMLAAGCGSATSETDRSAAAAVDKQAVAASGPARPLVEPKTSQIKSSPSSPGGSVAVSRVIGQADVSRNGKKMCKIDFVYAGYDPEDILWNNEPCKALTVELLTRADLEKWGKWDRLTPEDQKFIEAMPKGKVLAVSGEFTASIYPVGTTRLSYEVPVAD
jgi:hypothetical protein